VQRYIVSNLQRLSKGATQPEECPTNVILLRRFSRQIALFEPLLSLVLEQAPGGSVDIFALERKLLEDALDHILLMHESVVIGA